MRIASIGGGPAGLYFAILMKRQDPTHEVVVFERNRADDTFGFGVVFSDATLGNLEEADPETYRDIAARFAHWDDIDVHFGGEVLRSTGHGFCGLGRKELLLLLQDHCRELGVDMRFGQEVTDIEGLRRDYDLVLAADGVGSGVRKTYAEHFKPRVDLRPNRFVWLGTTFPFDAFTFYFKENQHGFWRVHAYRYAETGSTFIVECTGDTFARTGLEVEGEDATMDYMEELFKEELAGHRLIKNRSVWRQFPVIKNGRWWHENVVLVGDALHTAHFSIGSGTKLAMEDCIDLSRALARENKIPDALALYEKTRRPAVESLQRAAAVSREWFEHTERYRELSPLQFSFSLLTRSMRVTHENLRLRDPGFVAKVDAHVAESDVGEAPPPMFTPCKVGALTLKNRIACAPLFSRVADEGVVGDFHLCHVGARAQGGAALVMADWAAVSAGGRRHEGSAGLYSAEHLEHWARVCRFAKEQGDVAVGVVLGHGGRKALEPVSLSRQGYPGFAEPRVLSASEASALCADFAAAAVRALDAGFDWLDIDMAEGGLLAGWLSPLVRADDADLSARAEFPLQVLCSVRAAVGDRAVVGVRLSASDWAEGGFGPADAASFCELLREAGCPVVCVTSGGNVASEHIRVTRTYNTPFADRIRQNAGISVITEGNIASYDDVNSIVAAGRADVCALGRAHWIEPGFGNRAARLQGVRADLATPYDSAETFVPR